MNKEYQEAIKQAEQKLEDVKKRGKDAIGPSWEEVRLNLLTPEERTASNLRVALINELIRAKGELY